MHTNHSDGSDSVEELLRHLREAGIDTFSVTDHDAVSALAQISALLPEDMTFYAGVELSCVTKVGKCHILGYGIEPAQKDLTAILAEALRRRRAKLDLRLDYLQKVKKVEFSEEELDSLRKLSSPGKPHIAEIMIRHGVCDTIAQAIKEYIDPAPTTSTRVPADQAIDAVLKGEGIPVWAHPLGGEGERRIDGETFKEQLSLLLDHGIKGLECHYSRYTTEETAFLREQAKAHGLYISGGSDYHGKVKTVKLGELNCEGLEIEKEKLTILNDLKPYRPL